MKSTKNIKNIKKSLQIHNFFLIFLVYAILYTQFFFYILFHFFYRKYYVDIIPNKNVRKKRVPRESLEPIPLRSRSIRGSPGAGARFPGAKFIDRSAVIREQASPRKAEGIGFDSMPLFAAGIRYAALSRYRCVRPGAEDEWSLGRGNDMQMREPWMHPLWTLSARKWSTERPGDPIWRDFAIIGHLNGRQLAVRSCFPGDLGCNFSPRRGTRWSDRVINSETN